MAIGTAEITIKAVVKGFKREISDALKDIGTAPENAGKRAGREFAKGFKETSGNRLFSEARNQLKEQEKILSPYAKRVGRKVGKQFAEGFRETSGVRLFADFKKEVREAPVTLGPQSYKSGYTTGKEFSSGFRAGSGKNLFSGVRKELNEVVRDNDRLKRATGGKDNAFAKLKNAAEGARMSFNRLTRAGYLLGPAISGAVSAVGDLVFGLFAVGSAVGAAAPALAVLPGLLAAIAQGALTAKLAFGGVGKAIGGLLKQKTGSAGGGSSNDDAIADARRRLAQVYQQAAEKMASANDKVRKAQIALNQAYEEGAESLQQLGFDAEDASIAQSKAAIELERARETLLRTQDLPADSRMRREAELAFKQADLDYRQAADRSNDLAKAQEYAAKTGIEGTSEVQSAKESLAEAEADLFKTQRDNAQDILEAQLALQKAMQKTNASSASSVDLLKDLSAEAKRFAIYIASLKPEFLKLRAAAGEKLFGPLTIAIDMLVTKLFPVLKPMLTEMGGVIGNIARKFAEMLTRVDNLDIIERVFGGANIQIMRNLGDAFVDVAEGALNILDAVSPLTVQFSEFIKKTTDAWVGTMRFKNATGELTTSFERAAEFAKSIGGLLSSAYGAFKSLGSGASDSGKKIIDAFAGAFDKLKAFADEGNRTGALQAKFDAIADNVIAIGGFLGEVAKMFYEISGNKGVMAFFNAIKPIPGIFAEIFNRLTSTGPIFGELLVNISLLLKAFTETGGVQLFLSILNKAAEILIAVFSNEIVQKVFLFLAAVKGVTIAIGTLVAIATFAKNVVFGSFLFMARGAGIAGGATTALNTKIIAFNGLLTTATNRLIGMQIGMVTGSKGARTFRTSLTLVGQNLKTTITRLGLLIQALFLTGVEALKTGIKFMFSSKGVSAFGKAFTGPIKMMAAFTKQIWLNTLAWLANPIGLIVTVIVVAIAALSAVVIKAYQNSAKFQESVRKLGDAIKNALGDALKLISGALKNIMPTISSFSDAFKRVGDFIAKYIMPVIQFLVVGGIKVLAAYITYLIGLFKIFVNVLTAPFRLIYAFFKSLLTGDWSIIKDTFANIIDGIIGGVNTIIDAINSINPFSDIPYVPYMGEAKRATQELEKATEPLTAAQEAAKKKMAETAASAANLYKEFGDLKTIQATVRGEIENTFDKVTSGARALVNAKDAAKAFREETNNLTTTMKDGTLSTTQKKDALYAYSTAVLDAVKKDIELGGSQESTTKIIEKGREEFIKSAGEIGIFGTKAEELADKLALTPDTIKKTFEVSGLANLETLISKLADLEKFSTGSKSNIYGKTGEYKELKNEVIEIKAKIEETMTIKFGKGNSDNDPLYVEVTNSTLTPPKKAVGGPVSANKTYLVGEKGPELFTSNSAGKITPNGQLGNMSGGNSAPIINVHPSQGMDEIEISRLVSRQLAWTMRRGA